MVLSHGAHRSGHDGAKTAPMPSAAPATARANCRAGSSASPRPVPFERYQGYLADERSEDPGRQFGRPVGGPTIDIATSVMAIVVRPVRQNKSVMPATVRAVRHNKPNQKTAQLFSHDGILSKQRQAGMGRGTSQSLLVMGDAPRPMHPGFWAYPAQPGELTLLSPNPRHTAVHGRHWAGPCRCWDGRTKTTGDLRMTSVSAGSRSLA